MFSSVQRLWDAAVARNRQALAAIAAQLLATLDVYGGVEAGLLPRAVHAAVIRVLRPAESALRRLIVIAARDVRVEAVPQRAGPVPESLRKLPSKPATRMAFQLFDPRKRFREQQRPAAFAPRVFFVAPRAPFAPVFPQPMDVAMRSPVAAAADRHINAHRLMLRLKALTSALEDIPRQAQRLVRWRARRMVQQPPKFLSPLRPGKPPGHRARPQLEIDGILAECHSFALGVLSMPKPNTS